MAEKTAGLRDLVLRAAADPKFAEELLANPEHFSKAYSLAPEALDSIKRLSERGLATKVGAKPSGGGFHYYG